MANPYRPLKTAERNITGALTLDTTHRTVFVDATVGAVTVTLPTAATGEGYEFHIKKTDVSVNAVTIDGNGSETIDDATTQVLRDQYACLTIQSDGTEWFIL